MLISCDKKLSALNFKESVELQSCDIVRNILSTTTITVFAKPSPGLAPPPPHSFTSYPLHAILSILSTCPKTFKNILFRNCNSVLDVMGVWKVVSAPYGKILQSVRIEIGHLRFFVSNSPIIFLEEPFSYYGTYCLFLWNVLLTVCLYWYLICVRKLC